MQSQPSRLPLWGLTFAGGLGLQTTNHDGEIIIVYSSSICPALKNAADGWVAAASRPLMLLTAADAGAAAASSVTCRSVIIMDGGWLELLHLVQ